MCVVDSGCLQEKHLKVTVEPSVLLEKEINDDPKFEAIKNAFKTWDDNDNGTTCYLDIASSLV